MSTSAAHRVPGWLKVIYTLMVGIIAAVYSVKYPLTNFLWFSDVALLTMVLALWFENSLLASMMALTALAPEVAWNVDFFGRLLLRLRILGLSDYMFEPQRPLYLPGLSLFYVVLPILLWWSGRRLD